MMKSPSKYEIGGMATTIIASSPIPINQHPVQLQCPTAEISPTVSLVFVALHLEKQVSVNGGYKRTLPMTYSDFFLNR
ncbi:hypothetical protein [Nostoc sp.]